MTNYWQLLAGTLAGALAYLWPQSRDWRPALCATAGSPFFLALCPLHRPPTLRATLVQADGQERTLEPPSAAGLRPGYFYHVQLSGLPERLDRPDAPAMLFPTLEVRGSLALAPGRSTANFPVPIVLSNEDITKAQDGVLITKVFYLENPEESAGPSVIPGQPFELDVGPGGDPWAEARGTAGLFSCYAWGSARPVARSWRQSQSRERSYCRATRRCRPLPGLRSDRGTVGASTIRSWDPSRIPRNACVTAATRVCAGIGADGRLYGVEPADTVAEYTDSIGHRHVTPSNCVCIYAPRFAVARIDVAPASYGSVSGPNARQTVEAQAFASAAGEPNCSSGGAGRNRARTRESQRNPRQSRGGNHDAVRRNRNDFRKAENCRDRWGMPQTGARSRSAAYPL